MNQRMIHTPAATATGTRLPARDPRLRHWRLRCVRRRRWLVIDRAASSCVAAIRRGVSLRSLSGTLRVIAVKSLHALDDLRPLSVELQEVLVERLLLAL